MVRAGKANEYSLLRNPVSWTSIVVARVYRVSVVQAFADSVSFDDLVTHGVAVEVCWGEVG